jgi:hypothetical protein
MPATRMNRAQCQVNRHQTSPRACNIYIVQIAESERRLNDNLKLPGIEFSNSGADSLGR